jgi:hypothetical protein
VREIVDVHFPDIQKILVTAMDIFLRYPRSSRLEKQPSTSELLADWPKLPEDAGSSCKTAIQQRDSTNAWCAPEKRTGRDAV